MQQNAGSRGDDQSPSGTSTRRKALDARQYDSFVVRVWRHPGAGRLVRADIRHVQSGASDSAIDCDAGWISEALGRQLGEGGGNQPR
jgi:hypothetical protein